MKIILQVDKNFRDSRKFPFMCKNIGQLVTNGNDYDLHVDGENFVSLVHLKIRRLRQILDSYDDDEIILSIDVFDTITVASDSEIEQKFIKMDADVIYSVEGNCYPDERLKKHFDAGKFINGGGIIFRNGVYKKILSFLIDVTEVDVSVLLSIDQYLHQIYAIPLLQNFKIKLDTNNEIFQCLYSEDLSNFKKQNNRILNKKTNTYPCVFHGNGDDGYAKINTFFELFIKN